MEVRSLPLAAGVRDVAWLRVGATTSTRDHWEGWRMSQRAGVWTRRPCGSPAGSRRRRARSSIPGASRTRWCGRHWGRTARRGQRSRTCGTGTRSRGSRWTSSPPSTARWRGGTSSAPGCTTSAVRGRRSTWW